MNLAAPHTMAQTRQGRNFCMSVWMGTPRGQTSGGATAAMSRKTCFIIALSADTLCLHHVLSRDCGFGPPSVPHVLLGSMAIHFTVELTPSSASLWLMGKGCSWGWAEGGGLSPTSSSSSWLSALVLCALGGNKSAYPQGKSWGAALFQSRARGPWDVALLV